MGINVVADIQAWRINESLYGYCDKIKVVMIIDVMMIALPLQSSLTTLVGNDGKKICQEVYCTFRVSVVLTCIFLFHHHSGSADLTSSITTHNNSMCNHFGKCARKSTSPRTTQRLIHKLVSFCILLYLIVYPIKWSVCGRTNKDLADKSQALQSVAALSRACRSSPVI